MPLHVPLQKLRFLASASAQNGTAATQPVQKKTGVSVFPAGKRHEPITSKSYLASTAQLKSNLLRLQTSQKAQPDNPKPFQLKKEAVPIQKKENNTGLPDHLKSSVENLSGFSLNDVKVHYNSAKPAQLQAHAYAQGTDIHIAPGQEKHLPHEAWHVVQQKQGRVQPTLQMKQGVAVNDDKGLENEADVMGGQALQFAKTSPTNFTGQVNPSNNIIQAKRYTVSRNLPLETHYSLIEVKEEAEATTATTPTAKGKTAKGKTAAVEKTPKEKAQDAILGKLREAYKLSTENEEAAVKEKWSGAQRDERRGPEFLRQKEQMLTELDEREEFLTDTAEDEKDYKIKKEERSATGFWVAGAHVKGLSVASERKRENNPQSALIKKITKKDDWIGAHIIKKEWGGEDNMWNVVCWPGKTEKKWGKEFEEPIDMAFANRTIKKLDIAVDVEKEDAAFADDHFDTFIAEKTAGKTVSEQWMNLIKQNAKLAQIDANRAMESVPVRASGSSRLGTSSINSTDTNWDAAKIPAETGVKNVIENFTKKEPHQKQFENFKKEAVSNKEKGLTEEREEALGQEKRNYRPEVYDFEHNVD
jgi:hypothetical protein